MCKKIADSPIIMCKKEVDSYRQITINYSSLLNVCSEAASRSAIATATRSATTARPTGSARSEPLFPHFRFLTFLECGEAIGECNHAVAGEGIIGNIFHVVCIHVSEDGFLLTQNVIDSNAD